MKNNKKIFYLCILSIFIIGCATWTKVGGPYINNASLYRVDLPWGWMKYGGKDLTVTRDGIFLENIVIKRVNINDKLNHTKKKFVKGMLPEEIAEVKIDEIATDPDIYNFEIIENIPVIISGQNGFRLVYTFSNKDGLKYRHIQYGFGYEDWVYSLIYTATIDYYFDKNLEEFNKVIQSFKFIPSADKESVIPPSYTKEKKEDVTTKEETKVESAEPKEEPPVTEVAKPVVSTYAEYYRLLYNTVSKAVIKPEGSGAGVINAAFTLLSDGTLEDAQILEGSSEDTALRDVVLKAIKDSSPYPAFPDDIKSEGKKTFTITIEFKKIFRP